MTDPFVTALAAQFASPMAVAAAYTPAGGAPLAIRVIRSRPTLEMRGFGGSQVVHDIDTIELQASDVAQPARGDTLTIGTGSFRVDEDPVLDVEGLTWRCGIVAQ